MPFPWGDPLQQQAMQAGANRLGQMAGRGLGNMTTAAIGAGSEIAKRPWMGDPSQIAGRMLASPGTAVRAGLMGDATGNYGQAFGDAFLDDKGLTSAERFQGQDEAQAARAGMGVDQFRNKNPMAMRQIPGMTVPIPVRRGGPGEAFAGIGGDASLAMIEAAGYGTPGMVRSAAAEAAGRIAPRRVAPWMADDIATEVGPVPPVQRPPIAARTIDKSIGRDDLANISQPDLYGKLHPNGRQGFDDYLASMSKKIMPSASGDPAGYTKVMNAWQRRIETEKGLPEFSRGRMIKNSSSPTGWSPLELDGLSRQVPPPSSPPHPPTGVDSWSR